MIRNLLVPLDGSAFAEQALPWAISIAQQTEANLDLVRAHVFYALEDPAYGWAAFDPAEEAEHRQHEEAYLDTLARHVAAEHPIRLTKAVVDGSTVDAILGRAQEVAADLIVMTTHGRGPVSRAFLGSVADELIRRCPIPVLLIRPHEALPDLRQKPSATKVLIPLDGSPASEQVVGPAMQLGSALGASSYTLLHVVHPDKDRAWKTRSDRVAGLNRSREERAAEESLSYLEQVASRLRESSVELRTRVVLGAHVASAILEEECAQSYGLIAISSHGRSGFKRLLLGSVADKVLRGASCPQLLYRGTDH